VTDPFDALARPAERELPRARFARELRARLVAELGLDELDTYPTLRPERSRPMPTTTTSSATSTATASAVTPYLTAADAAAALDWYGRAFGAEEQFRVVMDDGRIGHAEFSIGAARFMLSDEAPALGVVSPGSLGGTSAAMHLTVTDVDALYARAVAAGATAQREPADQPYGNRQGVLVDPFGHRWMLSQPIGATEHVVASDRPGTGGGIWAVAYYEDALAAIRFLVDVVGFEEQLVVTGPDGRTVVHSQLRWPEGGIVQVGTYDPANPYSHRPGDQSLYVVTASPQAVWDRCVAAGVDVLREPESPDYDPEGTVFSVRDRERNIWSFGSYGLDAG